MSFELRPPAEWEVRELHEIAEISASNVDKKTTPGEVPVRLCNYTDVYNNYYIDRQMPFMSASAKDAEIKKFTLRRGDIIITKDSETPDDIGVPAVVREELSGVLCGYHLSLIRLSSERHDPFFLARQLASPRIASYFGRQANGMTRYGLNTGPIQQTEVWMPPPEEQRRIAEILDTADEAIQTTEALIAKLKQMKAGLLHDLLTRGIDENGELRRPPWEVPNMYQRSEVGTVTKEWDIETCRSVCEPITKGTTPKEFFDRAAAGRVPYLRVQNLSFDGSLLFEKEMLFVDERTHRRELKRSIVLPDDVLMNLVGPPLGKVSLVPGTFPEWNVNQAIAILRARGKCNPLFLSNYLQTPRALGWLLLRSRKTSGQRNLTLDMCRDLPIPIPRDPAEQESICSILLASEDRIRREKCSLEKLKTLKVGLMNSLLNGFVRVGQSGDVAV